MASSMEMLYIWHSQSIAFWTCSCMWPTLLMLFCSLCRILYLPSAQWLYWQHQHTKRFATSTTTVKARRLTFLKKRKHC